MNKDDTLRVHFYNPTDKPHTFTVDAPYSNDITVTNSTTIVPNGNTTITATMQEYSASIVGSTYPKWPGRL